MIYNMRIYLSQQSVIVKYSSKVILMGISRPPLKPIPRPEIMKKKRKRKDEIIRRPKAKLVF